MNYVQNVGHVWTSVVMEYMTKVNIHLPKVVNTDGCIQGCKGCGNLCPSGAINYVGDVGEKSDCNNIYIKDNKTLWKFIKIK